MAQWGTLKPSVMTDIFFCLSVQSQAGPIKNGKLTAMRGTSQATLLKAIWLDVDVGKEGAYGTLAEAIDAITAFVSAANLPGPSALVLSGGGVHVYWISDVPLTKAEWAPYAAGLRAEAERLGLKCDYGVTTDCARVLRVPGTFNRKTTPPRSCRVAALGRDYNFGVDLGRLATIAPAPAAVTATVTALNPASPIDLTSFLGKRPHPLLSHLDPSDSLAAGLNVFDDRPLNPDEVLKGCPHILEAARTHGAGYSQGLWMQDVLASTFFEDGLVWAHYMSKGHTTYSKDDTDAMYARKLKERQEKGIGWPSCTAFENEGCKLCATCVYKGKLKSPLNLAERSLPPAQPPPSAKAEEMHLPAGYGVDEDGDIVKYLEIQEEKGSNQTIAKPFKMFMVKILKGWVVGGVKGGLGLEVVTGKDTIEKILITDRDMATDQAATIAFCSQRCYPHTSMERYLREFVRSFAQKIADEKSRQETAPYGWLWKNGERNAFAYGGKVFDDLGNVREAGHTDRTISDFYMPTGKPDTIYKLFDVICDQNNPLIEIILAATFAAPLMYITGETNCVLWVFSREAGAHKSTSISTGAAVWGDPTQAREKSTTTMNYLENKMGILRNLPIVMDEITDEQKIEAVRGQLGNFTEPGTGGRLKRDRTGQLKSDWQTILIVGSNASLREVTKGNTKSTDAPFQRIFEIEAPKLPDTHGHLPIRSMVETLSHNYGHIGLIYADYLGKNHKAIYEAAQPFIEKFKKQVKYSSEERYWMAMCVSIIYGASLANQLLPKPYFHVDAMYNYLVKAYLKQREWLGSNINIAGTAINVVDVVGQFLKAYIDHQVWVDEVRISTGRGRAPKVQVRRPNMKNPVHVRWCQEDRLVQISKKEFDQYCIKVDKQQPGAVMKGLEKHFNAVVKQANLAAGIWTINQVAEPAIEFPITEGSPFWEMMLNGAPTDPVTAAPASPIEQAIATAAADLELVRENTNV